MRTLTTLFAIVVITWSGTETVAEPAISPAAAATPTLTCVSTSRLPEVAVEILPREAHGLIPNGRIRIDIVELGGTFGGKPQFDLRVSDARNPAVVRVVPSVRTDMSWSGSTGMFQFEFFDPYEGVVTLTPKQGVAPGSGRLEGMFQIGARNVALFDKMFLIECVRHK